MKQTCDWVIHNVNAVSFATGTSDYAVIENAVVVVNDGRIMFSGSADAYEQQQINYIATQQFDGKGLWLTPGLIDCHTHLVFAGNRADEFVWRLQGKSYEKISAQGGGILSSVKQTRAISEKQLFNESAKRLKRLLEEGVTTVEIKSGYGLNIATEVKMLRVAKALEAAYPVTVKTTFLGAHALAPEFPSSETGKQAYIDFICVQMLPEIHQLGLIDAVDVFCEGIGFSPNQCEQVYQVAKHLGLPIKAHVEQLSDLKGALKAIEYNALSVDHLEYIDSVDVKKLINTVAVLLPAAFYCLGESKKPPIEAFRRNKIRMAVASDLNPGTAPIASLLIAINQACVLFGLTPQESLKGATAYAAQALGLINKGRIMQGMDADLLLWDIQHPAELAYGVNFHRPLIIWKNGVISGGSQALSYDN